MPLNIFYQILLSIKMVSVDCGLSLRYRLYLLKTKIRFNRVHRVFYSIHILKQYYYIIFSMFIHYWLRAVKNKILLFICIHFVNKGVMFINLC